MSHRPRFIGRLDSIRGRLAVRHATMLAVVVLMIEGGSYIAVSRLLAQRGDRLLESSTSALVRDLHTELERGKPTGDAIAIAVRDVRFRDIVFAVRVVPKDSSRPVGAATYETRPDTNEFGGTRIRRDVIAVGAAQFEVTASRSLYEDHETLEAIQRAYLIAASLAILLSALLMWRLATAALAPIEMLATRAATLGSRDLHERLAVESPDDEIGRLTQVLNGMLARLEGSFAQQRQFVADASHELRTPIAVLRTEIDVTRANPARSAHEYRQTLERLDRVTGRLERLVADLFLLARVDAGGLTVPYTSLDAVALVRNTATLLHGIAEDRGVTIEVASSGDAAVRGSEAHLERVLLNLLDNALRFAPRDSAIAISVQRQTEGIVIEVSDRGPGVDPAFRDVVFDRFRRRTPDSVPQSDDGAGLGLAIAHALVGAHGGTLSLHATGTDGSTFRIVLPSAP